MNEMGGRVMHFKRQEGFRYSYKEPMPIQFLPLLAGKRLTAEQEMLEATLLDISPKGMKMFSTAQFGEHNSKLLQLEVHFILYTAAIRVVGEVVWVKRYANGYQYGLEFKDQENIENLIIEELKMLRRKEVLQQKESMARR